MELSEQEYEQIIRKQKEEYRKAKIRKKGKLSYTKFLHKVGQNSKSVILPARFMKYLNWEHRDKIEIVLDTARDEIVLRKSREIEVE